MPFCPNSSEFQKNNSRNIKHIAVLIFLKFLDFEQVSVDSEIPILGQAPRLLKELSSYDLNRLLNC